MGRIKELELEPFTTINWVSREAREVWESIIKDCAMLVNKLELLSVAGFQRSCAWRTVGVEEIVYLQKKCSKLGLIVSPIRNVGSWGSGFSHRTPPVVKGKPMSAYCVISKTKQSAKIFEAAFNEGDMDKQGELLGYPECCRKFFVENWKKGNLDPIPMMNFDNPHPISNPLLRYISLRVSFHIPCGLGCTQTIKMGKERLGILKEAKDKETAKLLMALLSMPVFWSSLHGIALIKTPIFYLRTNTMPALIDECTVKSEGSFYPREGAVSGSEFPFNLKEEKC